MLLGYIRESHIQFSQKLNVWARIYFEDSRTGEVKLRLVEVHINGRITENLELHENIVSFQQDRTPPHFFLWKQLISMFYTAQLNNLENLKQQISLECQNLTPNKHMLIIFFHQNESCDLFADEKSGSEDLS